MAARDTQEGGDHYKRLNPEPWEVMEGWNREHFIGFLRYNVLKRLGRWNSKNGATLEVRKSIHELQKLLEVLETPPAPHTGVQAGPSTPAIGPPPIAKYQDPKETRIRDAAYQAERIIAEAYEATK